MSIQNLSSGNINSVRISGLVANNLLFARDISFRDDEEVITIEDTFINITLVNDPIVNYTVATLDTIDPDQGKGLGFGFLTLNDVKSAGTAGSANIGKPRVPR